MGWIILIVAWCYGVGVIVATADNGVRLFSTREMDRAGILGWIVLPLIASLVPLCLAVMFAWLELMRVLRTLWPK